MEREIEITFQYLIVEPKSVRAASRSQPFEREPETFEELLDRSALTKEQRFFWLQLNAGRSAQEQGACGSEGSQ
jgi:hypothetical protein